jgi:hypothetical protein
MRRGLDQRSSAGGWARRCAGALAAVLCAAAAPAFGQNASLEYAVKATYLYKFAPFVSWRAGLPDAAGPFQICVSGDDPFGAVLDQAVAGQHFGRHPVTVKRIAAAARGMGCQVLYIGGSTGQSAADALHAVKGEPVLTITDAARSPDAKGVIHFWVVGGRVRFEIDAAAAAAQGLTVSSKLLALAAKAKA